MAVARIARLVAESILQAIGGGGPDLVCGNRKSVAETLGPILRVLGEANDEARPSTSASGRLIAARRRNFLGALWHGAFLSLGMSLTQPTTVLSAFIAALPGSDVWVGGLSTVLAAAGVLPEVLVARWIEPRPRKMPYLMLAIYLRVASWGILAWLIHAISTRSPDLLAWVLIGLLALFYAAGGLGGVPYIDIIGKVIPPGRRGAFFGSREALSGILGVGAALLVRAILADVIYPENYALLFGLAAAGLAVASLGFWVVREPPRASSHGRPLPWESYWRQLRAAGGRLKALVVVQLLTGFSLGALPFYVVFAKRVLGAPAEAVAWYLLAQVSGGVLANVLWAKLVDRVGSREMITLCASISAVTPWIAILSSHWGWEAMVAVFLLAGAFSSGRAVGFRSALLEISPPDERPTYSAVNDTLSLPIALVPVLAGLSLQVLSYPQLFALLSIFIAVGAVLSRRLHDPLDEEWDL